MLPQNIFHTESDELSTVGACVDPSPLRFELFLLFTDKQIILVARWALLALRGNRILV